MTASTRRCGAIPERFAAFTTLPTPDPRAAADELERTVSECGFKGGMVHGLTHGKFIDLPEFWPIFERAEALDVPIYLHPAIPHPEVVKAYYADYVADHPGLLTAGWGFTVETATQGIRMVLSGVFDAHPKLQVIIGHLGEGLPFCCGASTTRSAAIRTIRSARSSAGTSMSRRAETSRTPR